MLKFPRPGAVKTRLIPALGAARACDVHRGLVSHTLGEIVRFAAHGEVMVEARIADAPDEIAARAWVGNGLLIRDQGDGDLGARMARAVATAFAEKAEAVVVIGGDCAELTAAHLEHAFAALQRSDVVIGPAEDGGYYLIGMRRLLPELFQGIHWGTSNVLAQTRTVARALRLNVEELATLGDVDVPADLARWARTPTARTAGRGGISVIIPALDEEARLPATLTAVRLGTPHEIIVVDGGSSDRTAEVARAHDCIVLTTSPGRAAQMNAGAAIATGEILLFLHADTLPPPDYSELVRSSLAERGVAGGAFEFAIAGEFLGRRLVERGTNWRARWRQLPYGDQGIFVRRTTFIEVGGFAALPIMEDYELVRRLRSVGTIAIAPGVALTSGRRWQRLGAIGTTLFNQMMILGYLTGISPARLARWYHP